MSQYFRDEYTDFTFNGIKSSQMKVWITNSRDIKLAATPEFTDTFITSSFGSGQTYSQTNMTKTTFSLKCLAIDITLNDWRAIQGWLSPSVIGRLEFDFNDRTYYNAKISKAINGTTFVRGRADKLLGDLHIVEFSIDFTTVDDYAALGPVNVGVIGKKFGEDIDGVEYTVESVANNRYYLPSFYKLTDTIAAGEPVLVRNRTIHVHVDSATSLQDEVVLANFISGSIIDPNGRVSYVYRLIQQPNKIILNRIKWETGDLTITSVKAMEWEKDGGDLDVDLHVYGSDVLLCATKQEDVQLSFVDSSYAIINCGSYDMYPDIFFTPNDSGNKVYSFKIDNQLQYSYTMAYNVPMSISCKNGFAVCNGTIAENASYNYNMQSYTLQQMIVSSSLNEGPCSIPSSRAELRRIKVIDVVDDVKLWQTPTNPDDTVIDGCKLLYFIPYDDFHFDHDNSLVHLFVDILKQQSYNTGPYPYAPIDAGASYDVSILGSLVLDNVVCSRTTYQGKDCYALLGYFGKITEDTYVDITPLKNTTVYMSIGDATAVQIQGSSGFIHLQTRDAF